MDEAQIRAIKYAVCRAVARAMSKKILWRLTAYSSDRDCRPEDDEKIYDTETGRLLGTISLPDSGEGG